MMIQSPIEVMDVIDYVDLYIYMCGAIIICNLQYEDS